MDEPTQPEPSEPAPDSTSEAIETPQSLSEPPEATGLTEPAENGSEGLSEPQEEFSVESDPEPVREWAAELKALTAERDDATGRASELADHNAALRAQLLALTIENVKHAEKRTLADDVLSMLDTSKLLDADQMPDREAITAMVCRFGTEPITFTKSAASLGIGAYSASPPENPHGFNTRTPYSDRRSSAKLDARYR